MSNSATVAEALRILVPTLYLCAFIYLGALGGGHARARHLLVFGAAGAGGWMVLNEPSWAWLPPFITTDHWWILTLLGILALGILLFIDAIESSADVKWPWERAQDLWQWVLRVCSLAR